MTEGAWPEFDVEVCTKKKSTHGVCKSLMSLLDRTIPTRIVRASGMNGAPFLCEEVLHFSVIEQFSALV